MVVCPARAQAEERVGAILADVQSRGWIVEHDVLKQGRGNIDHVVHSPSMTFTIDTKRSWWRERDLDQAHRHAKWAAAHYGGHRPIVPVICVQRSSRAAVKVDGVVVVGSARLLGFLGSMDWPESLDDVGGAVIHSPRAAEIEDLLDPDARAV